MRCLGVVRADPRWGDEARGRLIDFWRDLEVNDILDAV